MPWPRALLLLLLLVSGRSLAQSPPPLVPAPPPGEQAEPPEPHGESIPYPYEPQLAPDSGVSAGRVMFELLGGMIGGVGGALAGGLVTGAFVAAFNDCADASTACGLVATAIFIPSVAVGMALGVYGFGKVLGGKGRFLPALYGVAAGAGAGLLLGVASNSGAMLAVGLVLVPIVGGIVGYELSHAQWAPLVGTTAHGGFVGGLSGRF